jgi:hypothetical protein
MMANWLSMSSVMGEFEAKLSLASSCLSHISSFAAYMPAMYSASVLESATNVCFFKLQLTAVLASRKM